MNSADRNTQIGFGLGMLIYSITIMFVCSCTAYYHEAVSANGNRERDVLAKIGGTASQKGADGSSIVTDDQASLRDSWTGATGMVTARGLTRVGVAKERTTQVQAQQTTAQKANAIPPVVTTPTVDAATGQVLTPVVTPASTTIPALPHN